MPTSNQETRREEVARRVHRLTTSGVSFESVGKAHTFELFGAAAAGIAILNKIPLDEAKEVLLASVD